MKKIHNNLKFGFLLCFLFTLGLPLSVIAGGIPGIPEVPKIPAFLPNIAQVPASQPMPIDGTWIITSIGKKVRIDAGRVYAVDGWLHMFVLDIQPGMVVQKNIMPTGPGRYRGEDLPLMGSFTANVQADRSLRYTVSTLMGPMSFTAMPVQLNNAKWFTQEMRKAGLIAQTTTSPGSSSGYQFSSPSDNQPNQEQSHSETTKTQAQCEEKVYDPATDSVRCLNDGE